jgi:hypothetical protein
MDQAVDNFMSDSINPTELQFADLMGRIGRTNMEMVTRQGPYRRADGIFQTGSTRQLQPGMARSIPFGIGAFAEEDPA